MNNIFNRVKEAVENAIANGYEPLAMNAQELAADLQEKAADFAEDTLEDITEAVETLKTAASATSKRIKQSWGDSND